MCVYYNHTISRSVSSSIHVDIYTMYMYIRLYIHNIPIPIHILLFLLFGGVVSKMMRPFGLHIIK